MSNRKTRVGILLSGRGSNFVSLHAAMERGDVPAEIVLVLSNKQDAPGLGKARERGIKALHLPYRRESLMDDEASMVRALKQHAVDWVCLAGFMRILSPRFVEAFHQRVLNIHPSLLPAFPGLAAQRQALEYGVKVAGCTVHLVDQGLDSGPIVHQEAVPVLDGDTEEDLSGRILVAEHRAYPLALQRLLREQWTVVGRRVCFGIPDVDL